MVNFYVKFLKHQLICEQPKSYNFVEKLGSTVCICGPLYIHATIFYLFKARHSALPANTGYKIFSLYFESLRKDTFLFLTLAHLVIWYRQLGLLWICNDALQTLPLIKCSIGVSTLSPVSLNLNRFNIRLVRCQNVKEPRRQIALSPRYFVLLLFI